MAFPFRIVVDEKSKIPQRDLIKMRYLAHSSNSLYKAEEFRAIELNRVVRWALKKP